MIFGVPEKWKTRDLEARQPLQSYLNLLLSSLAPAGQKCCKELEPKDLSEQVNSIHWLRAFWINYELESYNYFGLILASATLVEDKMLFFFS